MKKSILSIVLFCIVFIAKSQTTPTCNPYPKTITVTGIAEMNIVPDEIYVEVELKEYKKKNEEKTDLEKIKNDFLVKCKSVGIDDSLINISSYEGKNYNRWYWKKRKKDPDMYASISYEIKFRDSKKMDALMDVLDDDATNNFRVIKTSHSKIQEYRKQLKIQAVKVAKEKGIYLSESINEKLGEAITIIEPTDESIYSYDKNSKVANIAYTLKYRKQEDNYMTNDEVDLDFKKMNLKYDVTIIFALK